MIVTDQERSFADIPAKIPMPAHEWLRERGVTFENYHVNTSPCGPSRSVMYTGLHTQRTGMFLNPNNPPYPEMKPDLKTVGHMLRQAGYHTSYKGKWHLSNIDEALAAANKNPMVYPVGTNALEPFGFSGYNFSGERVGLSWQGFMEDGATAAEAVNQLKTYANGDEGKQPWFMAVNFINPHDIMFFDATGEGEKTRALPNLAGPLLQEPGDPIYQTDWDLPLPRSFYEDDLSGKPSAHAAQRATSWAFYGKIDPRDEKAWKRNQNYYFNCIRDMNRHAMTVLEALESTGQLEDTIVIYTSDHGERAGAHGMRQKAGTMYREEMCVPFVVVHPDIAGGSSVKSLASSLDIVPTVLAFAGVQAGEHPQLAGHDVSAALTGGKTRRDEVGILFNYAIAYGWKAPNVAAGAGDVQPLAKNDLSLRRLFRGVHDGRYKFARYFAPAQHHTPLTWEQLTAHNDLELYDVEADRPEINNLARDPSAHRETIMRLNQMTNALVAAEVGVDDASEFPGPKEQYNTLTL